MCFYCCFKLIIVLSCNEAKQTNMSPVFVFYISILYIKKINLSINVLQITNCIFTIGTYYNIVTIL